MNQASYFETKQQFSPTTLTIIIGLHAAALMAAIAWKTNIIPIADPPIVVTPIRVDPDPAPQPKETEPRPRPVDVYIPPSPIPLSQQDSVLTQTVWDPPIPDPPTSVIERPKPDPLPAMQPARAKGDVRSLFTADDYPEAARRREETGAVRVKLEIGANGSVTGCSVVASSGSALLDSTTCKVLKSRAHFAPARDTSGQPVGDSYVTPRIVWTIEGKG